MSQRYSSFKSYLNYLTSFLFHHSWNKEQQAHKRYLSWETSINLMLMKFNSRHPIPQEVRVRLYPGYLTHSSHSQTTNYSSHDTVIQDFNINNALFIFL